MNSGKPFYERSQTCCNSISHRPRTAFPLRHAKLCSRFVRGWCLLAPLLCAKRRLATDVPAKEGTQEGYNPLPKSLWALATESPLSLLLPADPTSSSHTVTFSVGAQRIARMRMPSSPPPPPLPHSHLHPVAHSLILLRAGEHALGQLMLHIQVLKKGTGGSVLRAAPHLEFVSFWDCKFWGVPRPPLKITKYSRKVAVATQ